MDERERKEALLEAVRDLVEDQPPPPPQSPQPVATGRGARTVVGLLASWAFLGWLWIARPALVFGPATETLTTPEQLDAAMRVSLWLERGRIDEYLELHGRLPGSLEDAGPVEEEISWIRRGNGYVLSVTLDTATLIMSDRMDADSFLGNALAVLRR